MFNRNRNQPNPAGARSRSGPFKKRTKHTAITALDIEGGILRVVQASGVGPATRITRISSAPLDVPPEKRDQAALMGAAIRKGLDALKLKPKEVVFCIPRGQLVLRPLQVPAVDDLAELASVVNFQIAKDLPFRVDEAVVDFKLLRIIEPAPATPPAAGSEPAENPAATETADTRGRFDLLVGATRSTVVQFYRDLAKTAGFKLAGLGLRSGSSVACVARDPELEPGVGTLLISLRNDETTLDIFTEEKLVFSRVAGGGVPPASDAEMAAYLRPMEIEVVRSLHGYEGTPGHAPLKRLLVAGGTGAEAAVMNALAPRLNLPGKIVDPAAFLELKGSNRDDARAAVAAIGLAISTLSNSGLPLDFANPKKPAVQRNTKRTKILIAVTAAMVLLFGLFAVRANLVKKRTAIRDQVQAQWKAEDNKVKIYRSLKSQARVVNNWLAEEENWLDHLAYLSSILPGADQIYVSAFATTPQHVIRFSVHSRTGELLAELDRKLRAAGYEVKPLSITPANDRHGYNFRTTVELSIPKKMEPDLTKVKPPARPADDTPRPQASLKSDLAMKGAAQS